MNVIWGFLVFVLSYFIGIFMISNIIYPLFVAPGLYKKLKNNNCITGVPAYSFFLAPLINLSLIIIVAVLLNQLSSNLSFALYAGLFIATIKVLLGIRSQQESLMADFISSWSKFIDYEALCRSNIINVYEYLIPFTSLLAKRYPKHFYNENELPLEKDFIEQVILFTYEKDQNQSFRYGCLEALLLLTRYQKDTYDTGPQLDSWVSKIVDDSEYERIRGISGGKVGNEQWEKSIKWLVAIVKKIDPEDYTGFEKQSLREYRKDLKKLLLI